MTAPVTGGYQYTECGLDNIYLVDGFTFVDRPSGREVKITNIDGLHEVIGKMLITDKKNLSGKEIRFLRQEMLMSQAVLAKLLEVAEQTVLRWEKGKADIPKPAETLIRLLYREHIKASRGLGAVASSPSACCTSRRIGQGRPGTFIMRRIWITGRLTPTSPTPRRLSIARSAHGSAKTSNRRRSHTPLRMWCPSTSRRCGRKSSS